MAYGRLAFALACLLAPFAGHAAGTDQVLHNFYSTPGDGKNPQGGLVMDKSGALIGTTYRGGTLTGSSGAGIGTVFRLAKQTGGKSWVEKILHVFPASPDDATNPVGNLVMDAAGAVYGVAEGCCTQTGPGVVYKLSPPAHGIGEWTETVIHQFAGLDSLGHLDGNNPAAGLIADRQGVLYGTAGEGGSSQGGVVYKLAPPAAAGGAWVETVLYNFSLDGASGTFPESELSMDAKGNLFGTTSAGGLPDGSGTVFELSPPVPGQDQWTETTLHTFMKIPEGLYPDYGVTLGPDGSLFGVTPEGGVSKNCFDRCGDVFQLTPPSIAGGAWAFSLIYSFTGIPDGEFPEAPLSVDAAGNLYGSTGGGGVIDTGCRNDAVIRGCGTVFVLMRPAGGTGTWTEKVRASPSYAAGSQPSAGVLLGRDGYIYGTAFYGGTGHDPSESQDGYGTVFRVKNR